MILILLVASCSTFRIPLKKDKGANMAKGGLNAMDARDYADHLASLKEPFLSTPGIKKAQISPASRKYLEQLTSDIISKNEIFLKDIKKANITIIDSESPLHFSLPKGEIFLSSGLIAKYLKHESMLVGILSFEIFRSAKLLYPRQIVIPVGFVLLERMLQINRLSVEEKMEVHKWAFYLTVRSGFDGEYYLTWLQTQNRNTADFILLVGDANQINREESLFKAFLIKNTDDEDNAVVKKNSSKNFYTLLNSIRDGSL